jgi:hypothetical protein
LIINLIISSMLENDILLLSTMYIICFIRMVSA